MKKRRLNLLLIGGGSGGHIYPLISIENELKKSLEVNALYIATNKPVDANILSTNNKKFILLSQLESKFTSLKNPIFLYQSISISLGVINDFRPDLAITTGSRVSIIPTGIAKLLGIPIVIVELNYIMGKVPRFLAPIADKLLTCWQKNSMGTLVFGKKRLIDPPIRKVNASTNTPENNKLKILVVGGSQGARILNQNLPILLSELEKDFDLAITHICGPSDHDATMLNYKNRFPTGTNISILEFTENLPSLISKSDIIISRAGANIIFESAYFKKPLFLIPIKSSSLNHQYQNARQLAKAGCAILIEENMILSRHTKDIFVEYVKNIDVRERMGKRLFEFFYKHKSDLIEALSI